MKTKLLLLLIIATNIVLGQDGTKDTSFSTTQGVDNIIYATAVQSDGKILIAGDFTLFGDFSVNRLARLNADGTLDTSFTPIALSGSVRAIAVQSDGKILVGGNFGSGIRRLNSNGTNDTSFAVGVGANNFVVAIAIQPDGKIIIGGTFQTYQSVTANRIQRLNSDGSRDTSFDAGNGPSAAVRAIAIRPDGRLIIGGDFSNYGSFIASRIAIIESDGGFDSALNTNSGFNSGSSVFDIELLPDGKFVAVGAFTSHGNATNTTTTVNRIALFDAQGNLDFGFNPALGGANAFVNSIAKTADNKYIIGGLFSSYNGTSRLRVAKLNADLTLDTSFNPGTGVNNEVNSVSIQSDGKVILGGAFTSFNGGSVVRVVRLNNTVNVPSQCPPAGDTTLNNQTQVDDFIATYPNCTTIDGNLIINGATITDITGLNQITTINGALSILNTGITNGAIFNNLTQVTGQLTIQSNTNLTALTGFNALVNAGETLQILNNQNITGITGFSNLVTVTGNLSLLSTTATLATTDISGFSNVQSVGYLLIRRMPLTNLSQFSSLNTILRGLSIDTNPNLTSIASLSSVTNAVNGNGTTPFRIFANPLLQSLNGINFSSVTNCSDVQILQLPLVTSLQPLSSINGQIGGLLIQFNSGLLNLNGLEGITNVNGNVAITNNAALLILNGLQNITTITGSLGITSNALITQLPNWNLTQVLSISLSNNAQLSSISSLSGITSLSAPISGLPTALSITSSEALTSLNGLQNLTTLNNANINLQSNNNLTDITALNGLNVNSINGLNIALNTNLSTCGVSWVCGRLALNTTNVTISSNANGCFDIAQVQTTCSSNPCPTGNVTLNSQLDVDTFVALYPNCTTIDGDLTISGTFINSLVGLSNLTTINGSLRITNNTALSSLNGLENITAINGVLNISFNPLITQLPNWNLTQVNSIAISTNTNLNSIASLTGVTSLTTANTSGSIMALTIFGCPALTSLNGLQNLSFINNFGVFIAFNNNLTDISALNNLNIASISSINVENNNSLTTCNVPWICNFLISNASNALLNNNATGCQSNVVVQNTCDALSTDDFNLSNLIKIYPNPFNNQITFDLGSTSEKGTISIHDILGKQLYQTKFDGSSITIDNLGNLPAGIYIATLNTENGTSITRKIIK